MPPTLDRLYLDSCILNRPADDQTQLRIRAEAHAIEEILEIAADGRIHWIASSLVQAELSRNPDQSNRADSLRIMRQAAEFVAPTPATMEQAAALQAEGFGQFDALHLALAVQARAGWLLTVDDRFLRRSARLPPGQFPIVRNPLDWIRRRKPWLLKS